MEWLSPILMAVQVISSISVIVLVLLQQGKGADMGSAFGSGSAGSLFGAAGAANFLSRTTKWAAIVFFVSTAALAWQSHQPQGGPVSSGVMQGFEVPQVPGSAPASSETSVPAVPSAPAESSVPSAAVPSAAVPQVESVPAVPEAPAAGEPAASGNDTSAPSMSVPAETAPAEPASAAENNN